MVGFNAIYNTSFIFIGFSKYFVGNFSHRTVKINSLLQEYRVQQSRQSYARVRNRCINRSPAEQRHGERNVTLMEGECPARDSGLRLTTGRFAACSV